MPTRKNQKKGGYINNKTRNKKKSLYKSNYFKYIAKQQYNNYRQNFSKSNKISGTYKSSIA
jgi:hypothetical protein